MSTKPAYLFVGRQVMKLSRFLNIANTLSLVRLGLLPLILLFLSFSEPLYARMAFLFMVVAFVTDALDGWFARRLNQVSLLGEILDPIIDKAYTISIAFFLIIFRNFPLQIASIILVRDFLILALGYLLFRSHLEFPRSNWLGKLTGCVYGATALAYTIRMSSGIWFAWTSFAFALISGVNYFIYFQKRLKTKKN